MKTFTLALMFVLCSTWLVLGSFAVPQINAAQAGSQPSSAYQFRLVQGKDVSVCQAYVDNVLRRAAA